jgi:hypothetical protein
VKKFLKLAVIFLILGCIGIFLGTRNKIQPQKEQIYTIDDFSDNYYGKMKIENPKEVFSKGWITIYDKKSNKEIIKVESEQLTFKLHDGKIKSNILELPYGEQSNIIYKDFNFDGVNDFALMDGQKSCYHGPSFRVYLASKGTFIYDENFTRLAQQYCGMFNVDYEKKEINTMTKSGCCWHEYSDYKIINNIPQLVSKRTEDSTIKKDVMFITDEKLVNDKWVVTNREVPIITSTIAPLQIPYEYYK